MNPPTVTTRESLVDLIRGFALFGICCVNLPQMGVPWGNLSPASALSDRMAATLLTGLFEAKSFPLFAFIFGWGIGQHWERTSITNFAARHLRRVAALAILGLAHGILVYSGDILLPYALLALLIWPCLLLPNIFRLALAALTLPFVVIGFFLLGWMIFSLGEYPVEPSGLAGTFIQGVHQRLEDLPDSWLVVLLFNLPLAFAAALVGAAAAKVQWPATIPGFLHWGGFRRLALRVTILASFLVSLAVATGLAWWGYATAATPWLLALLACAAVPQVVGYLLAIRWLHAKGWRPNWLLAAGRNSLTCYVTQGVLASWIFGSYGLGLYAELGEASLLGLAFGVALVASGSAVVWEKLMGRGPLEYLLNWATGARR